ncbi:hypothetical protein ABVT39_000594 [Epinephelus coioides]
MQLRRPIKGEDKRQKGKRFASLEVQPEQGEYKAVCVRLWLWPQCHWRGRVNRPVRSPRISVGLECAVALAMARDTTLGVGREEEGLWWLAAEQVLG